MLDDSIKQFSLKELQELLAKAERNLVLARENNHGAVVTQQNKNQVEKVRKAIAAKRDDPFSKQE